MNKKTYDLSFGFDTVTKLILDGFYSRAGPGELPITTRNKTVRGIIVPGYAYEASNVALAWAYKEIAEAQFPNCYIILGADTSDKNLFSTYLFSGWETSLGLIHVDIERGKKLLGDSALLRNSAEPFEENTFIDTQLPFLQFANKSYLDKIRFLPILVGNPSYDEIRNFADILSDIQGNICFIASANLTYYGKQYGSVPFVHGIKHNIDIKDQQMLRCIFKLDVAGFLKSTQKWNVPDKNAIALFLEIMRGFGYKEGKLLSYYTSGDIEGYENSVSFCSLVF